MRAGAGARAGRGLLAAVMLAPTALCAGACGAAADTISREEFVEAYVALRVAELEGAGNVIPDAARDSVFTASGVSEEDLDGFVEAHGRDVVFMADIWTEVDSLMDARSDGSNRVP